jgi:hypothetical protein
MNMGHERRNMVQHRLLCGTSPEVMHKLAPAGIQNHARILQHFENKLRHYTTVTSGQSLFF